jgi:two-component system sensor histidine kinase VicK
MTVLAQNRHAEIFGTMIEESDEVFFIFDAATRRFIYVNAAFEDLTKKKCEDLYSNPNLLLKIIHEDDLKYVKASFHSILKERVSTMLDFRIIRPDETERWMRLKIYPVTLNAAEPYFAGIAEDDTARKASIVNMEKVNGWKDANLEIIAHDLRGPIGTVKMLASIIDKNMPNNKEVHKLTQMIEDISKRNITLIQTLLSREAQDTAEVEISKERLDVVWEIHQALDIYILSQEDIRKDITFTHSHETIFAEVDSMKFLQIINNLVSNAIKFTKEDGRIKLHVEKLDGTFLVSVEDNGVGIPKNLHPFLFTKYTKAGRTGLHGEESIGLGMWIVKRLTESHGGKVWFESQVEKGSTFYVEIPLGLAG